MLTLYEKRRSDLDPIRLVLKFCSGERLMGTKGWAYGVVALLAAAAWAQQSPSGEDLLRRAIQLHQSGDTEAAIRDYRAYLKQAPQNVMARSNLGAALSRGGHYEDAIVEYKQALDLDSNNVPVRLNLALAYYKTAQLAEAAEQMAVVIRQQPSNRQAIFLAADCDLRLGENKKVIELLAPLEKESPNDKALIY